MSVLEIKSNLAEAEASVAEFKITEIEPKHPTLTTSNVSGMRDAVKIANRMIKHIPQLEQNIKEQAEKFGQIAKKKAEEDGQICFK